MPACPKLLQDTVIAVARDVAFCFIYAANLDCLQSLGSAARTRDSLVQHVADNRPVWAGCGGMMALFETLVTVDGVAHAQWALLSGEVRMNQRLVALGPQQLALKSGTLRGHTFHSSTIATTMSFATRTTDPEGLVSMAAGEALWQRGSVPASSFHAWFPSAPAAVAELFSAPAHEAV